MYREMDLSVMRIQTLPDHIYYIYIYIQLNAGYMSGSQIQTLIIYISIISLLCDNTKKKCKIHEM